MNTSSIIMSLCHLSRVSGPWPRRWLTVQSPVPGCWQRPAWPRATRPPDPAARSGVEIPCRLHPRAGDGQVITNRADTSPGIILAL